jgi:transcriptional regulator NrdR
MHCLFCQHPDTRVIDSRVSEDGATIRRRRVCEACGERFSTLETVELKLPAVIKSDGGREAFDARKLRTSFDRALQKRPVAEEQVEAAVRAVIHQIRMGGEREIPSIKIGEFVMAELRKLDHVGYAVLPRSTAPSRTWPISARPLPRWKATPRMLATSHE